MVKMASQGDNEKEREDAAARCVQYIVQFYGVLKTHFRLSKHSGWFFLSLNLYATVKKAFHLWYRPPRKPLCALSKSF